MEKYRDNFILSSEEISKTTELLKARIEGEITDELRSNLMKHGGEHFFQEYMIEHIYTQNAIPVRDLLMEVSTKLLGKDVSIDDANQYFGFLCFMAYILNIGGIYNHTEGQNISHDDYLEYAKQYFGTVESFSIEHLGERIHADKNKYLPRKNHLQAVPNSKIIEGETNKVVSITRKKPALQLVVSNE